MEHFSREVPVEELNSIPNWLGKGWARDRCGEGFKIQLENEVAILPGILSAQPTLVTHDMETTNNPTLWKNRNIRSIDEFFFELQILWDGQVLDNKGIKIHSDVLPHTGP